MYIELQNITKSYKVAKQDYPVLKGISLSIGIEQKNIIVLQGSSGSGKSTLLNLIGALDKPTAGDIYIDGHHINKMNDTALTNFRFSHIGFVFQHFNLIPVLSAYENIEYPLFKTNLSKKERHERVDKLVDYLKISAVIKNRPVNLSGGQQQRVAIARSLINNPKVLLADEPTASLDLDNTKLIMDLLSHLSVQEKLISIIATHDPIVAEFSSNILKLQNGVLV
ncbi:MAG: ABC transporter ATP-binding protein [Alphaproteobacteria bacterium]|jgi:putative ABC transport system ATP-binding protein|nr:ABC transporter ATP-binding protein [Alphaproteobacteria bacterium]